MKKTLFLIAALTLVSCSKEKPAEPVAEAPPAAADVASSTTTTESEDIAKELGMNETDSAPIVTAMLGMVKQESASLETRKQAASALKDQLGGGKALTKALAYYEAKPKKSKDDLEMIETIKSERAKIW